MKSWFSARKFVLVFIFYDVFTCLWYKVSFLCFRLCVDLRWLQYMRVFKCDLTSIARDVFSKERVSVLTVA